MKKERFYSLDVFRGLTVLFMILVDNPGEWEHVYKPLIHSQWIGCTPADLVFPFFLFVTGNTLSFVIPRMRQAGTLAFFKKIIIRSLLIFVIGLFLNWFPFVTWHDNDIVWKAWQNVRIMGILQRIAIAYFFASIIVYFCKPKAAIIISIFILAVYWLLCYTLGANGDPYSISGWFGMRRVDIPLLSVNHLYIGGNTPFDPEGIASSFTPIVQVIIGYLAGKFILEKGKTFEMVSQLFVVGLLLIFVGLFWGQYFPFIKKIWTSSYVLYTSGIALVILATVIYFIELRNKKFWFDKFCDIFGKNPLFIFILNGLIPTALWFIRIPNGMANQKIAYISLWSWLYMHICNPISSNYYIDSLLFAICFVLFLWLITFWMYKKKIYIKI